jgi:hypothetical protein
MARQFMRVVAIAGFAALLCGAAPAWAQTATAPSLGAAQSFAVVAASTVTNTGPSVVTGDIGLHPGTSVTGFPPGIVVSGTTHINNASALDAKNAVIVAYNDLAGQACTEDLTGQDLGGMTLTQGVYCFSDSAGLTGTLTLDAEGSANAVFIFQIASTLTTASNSSVVLINGGSLCNVFWQVGSSATLGTSTSFAGNILALASITLTTGANVTGRTLVQTGAVTLDSNNVTATCTSVTPPPVCPAVSIEPAALPSGTVGVAYSETLTGSGGTPPYTFAVTSGALPPGVTLTPAGVVAGTPTTAGSYNVTIRGTDVLGCFGTATYVMVIAVAPEPPPSCPVISISPPTLPDGTVGVAYTQTLTGSGGTGPYSFGVSVGTLPAGLTLSAAGALSGTPTIAGTTDFTILVTDVNGCFASVSYSIVVAAAPVSPPTCPVVTISPVPDGTVGVAYSETITGSGGAEPYTFGVTTGALPAGLTLTAEGLLSGTPTTAGTSAFSIRGTDANGCYAELLFSLTIAGAVAVPTLPQVVLLLLAAGLAAVGYLRLRRRARAG